MFYGADSDLSGDPQVKTDYYINRGYDPYVTFECDTAFSITFGSAAGKIEVCTSDPSKDSN